MLEFVTEKLLAAPTFNAVTIYSLYYAYICVASLVLPSIHVKGHPHPKRGPQQEYDICGFRLTILTILLILLFGGIIPELHSIKLFNVSVLVDEFWPLMSTVNIFAFLFSAFLYLKSHLRLSILGENVDNYSHGSLGLDFWVGRELYPRIGKFDIKFVAYRVAMLFWLVLNLAFLDRHMELSGGSVSGNMLCYQITTGFYVLDYFWNEEKMLTTWDIINEEFGYMLVFGDYVFIPFVFSIQCHYLLASSGWEGDSQYLLIALNLIIFAVGYYVFRTSNSQKNQFKTDPAKPIWDQTPQAIGGKLLVSGFWGWGRHMNYTGDLIMALAYCMPCGLQIGGYFYAIYLTILLTHRAFRDDAKCAAKYQDLWKQYNQKVKYVFIPFEPFDIVLRTMGKALYYLTNKDDIVQSEKEKSQKSN